MAGTKSYLPLLLCVMFQLISRGIVADGEQAGIHVIKSKDIAISVSDKGEITAVSFVSQKAARAVDGLTSLAGCVVKDVKAKKLPDGGMKFIKTLFHEKGKRTLTLVEQFTPTATSIRWEIEIKDSGKNWSTSIQTQLQYPDTVKQNVKFWTAWAEPRREIAGRMNEEQLVASGIKVGNNAGGTWADPLIPVPIGNAYFWYGAPPYRYGSTGIPYSPYGDAAARTFCIPIATLVEPGSGIGLSLVLSPEDFMLEMIMKTTEEGKVTFTRYQHRLGQGKPVRFAMDLVAHQADWREGLGWMTQRYGQFFDPPNPRAHQIAGTGAYSNGDQDFDVEKMKAMGFMVNWRASLDFPYMGMFLPPVDDNVSWPRFIERYEHEIGNRTTSIGKMRDYAHKMRQLGFHVLSYFNVFEFGTRVVFPAPPRKIKSDADLWKNCNDFLYAKLADAIVITPQGEKAHNGSYGPTRPGLPYHTWGNAVILDPSEPVYQEFLLEQARRHIEKLPDASGFCIDRLDWLRLYNHQRDDGLSWFGGQAVRSLTYSWHDLMSKLGPLVHKADKVIYCNNHVKRLETLRHIDGLFDEFTTSGPALNITSLLGTRKPVLGWTGTKGRLSDEFFQKFLYMGVFPMCPFPGNNHSLLPNPSVDKSHLDFGPLMIAMRGKKWVLEPHVVSVPKGNAKANIFEVPSGFIAPVVYAGDAKNVKVVLRSKKIANEKYTIQALHPGTKKPAAVVTTKKGNSLILDVPVHRGCAMVQMLRK